MIFRTSEPDFLLVEKRAEALNAADRCRESAHDIPEQPYEGCMHARIITDADSRGVLLIRFDADLGLPKLPIHFHPKSDRKIFVVSGQGTFHFVEPKTGRHESVIVSRGDFVSFPKGFLHTFTTADSEMTVLAAHEPFQDLHDPDLLDYDESGAPKARERSEVESALPIKMRVR